MAQVVMLTGLAGDGIDIVAGDICECSEAQAARFIDFQFARAKTPADNSRRVKQLDVPKPTPSPRTSQDGKEETGGNEASPSKPSTGRRGKAGRSAK